MTRPECGGGGKRTLIDRSLSGASTRSASMRAMRFSQLWAWAAFDCLAPNRSTSDCSRATSRVWAAATLASRISSRARAAWYWL